ncbi:Hypothetical Protein FCC1311_049482 [Hondaea fermentalgiana]|uniref:Uncharacterized protein n=1 Tax=Hondaea fermentalgiana TaxID=2315210 RepID=A0A2R5GCM0_9STRA|nr:Hypothetical Protein FCC1311_049482 [Hondaea fermentalgiana]|eukprot:GBG28727.1 Hypothetical Protein FCC1311_049482 [Hondaea fermentalgiana]
MKRTQITIRRKGECEKAVEDVQDLLTATPTSLANHFTLFTEALLYKQVVQEIFADFIGPRCSVWNR